MPTRKRSRSMEIHGYSPIRKRSRRSRSMVGRSPTIPSIVRNSGDMTKVMNGMKRIENMIIAVTAEWCGACQRIKKQLHAALRSNSSGIAATNVDLDMLNKNPFIPPPSAVPSIGIYSNGKLVKEIADVDELTSILNKRPASAVSANTIPFNASQASEEFLETSQRRSAKSSKPTLVSLNNEEEEPLNTSAISIQPNNKGRPASVAMAPVSPTSVNGVGKANSSSVPSNSTKNNSTASNSTASNSTASNSTASNSTASNSTASNSIASPVAPPAPSNDQSATSTTPSSTTPSSPQLGGNLYGSLASTAYQLAPPAVLLGIASSVLGTKRRSKKARRRH